MPAGGEEFSIDCPIAAATDLDMGTSLGLQPPISHVDEETLLWIKRKLESCVSHNHFNPNKTFIPDRLIDVRGNQLSLVLTKDFQARDAESHRYIALTYCWGPEPHASKQLKTTTFNISQHQQQIPETFLPQVIKDAITITRALSVPFLWVDALCILQDDVSDWEHQCRMMEQIYGNAYTAVAAVSSQNCEEGFVVKTNRILFPFRDESGHNRVFGIYPPPYQADTQHEVRHSPWFKRGWTFQERIASTRILMFSERNLHFKCKYFDESMGRERTTSEINYGILDRVTIDSGSTVAIYQEWNKIIAQIDPEYHQFTRETDFLPSIAGIALLFSKRLNDDYAAGYKPWFGNLLKRLKTPSPYIAPSWSWASRRETFWFHLYRSELLANCRPEFDSLEIAVTLRGESVFGEVRDAALDITTKVYAGSRRITYHEVSPHSSSKSAVQIDGRYFAEIEPDCTDLARSESTVMLIGLLLISSTIRRYEDAEVSSLRYSDKSETLGDEEDAGSDFESLSASTNGKAGIRLACGTRVKYLFKTLMNEGKKMVHDIPGAESDFPQRCPPKTTPSKKPSEHVFDANGDTRIILSTYMAQTFEWEIDKVRIKQEMPTKVYYKEKKQEKKEGKRAESLITTSTSLGGTTNRTPIDWGTTDFSTLSNVRYSRVEFSDDDDTDLGCTVPGTNRDSTSIIQDWNYGEKCARSLKKIDFRLLVSGKHLELASSVFKKMLTGPFAEGKADVSGFRLIKTSDWDPEAFKITLTIIHGYNRDVPRSLSLEMLVKVAMIINYYDCLESVEPYTDIWLEALRSELPTVYGRECILCLFISWAFAKPVGFQNMTELALRHSQKLIEVEDFPIPAKILEAIDIARQSALAEIFSAIYELLDRLQEEQECSFECSSMLLGILTRELSKHEILHPRNAPPFNGFSIEESDLRAFDLQDFQDKKIYTCS
ncbi:uncharacterized protein FTJAE_11076 [Fusarium tjaetaba]|uniref:Heterokaryon incompatibility domain-containing protein n=1 Tax=Fusarium tjaetaba TaxID=1567544 RepID=A0A8H5QWC7_9HYPO|nr:uncharacterized protein FTJAE_11076 [Fusarium tjaetaba]KAF5622109.1 hypothetical protein FTJAE_11076 [Fusarium tjaetaba]